MSTVLLDSGAHPGVRILTLDDPDRRNAMSPALTDALADTLDAVAADPDARVLVVAANGPAFCAGADLPAVFGNPDRPVGQIRAELRRLYDSFLRIRRLEIPTIAAVHGAAVGAGVNLALSCDIRIAGPQARFGITFTRLGLHPGGGCTHFLTEQLGAQRALAVLLDGATLDAQECHRTGLVLEVVPDPLTAAVERAARYAGLDPELARDIKRAVRMAGVTDFETTLEFEAWSQAASAQKPDVARAIGQILGRRRPQG
jgi:enoyl-CoA hydratase